MAADTDTATERLGAVRLHAPPIRLLRPAVCDSFACRASLNVRLHSYHREKFCKLMSQTQLPRSFAQPAPASDPESEAGTIVQFLFFFVLFYNPPSTRIAAVRKEKKARPHRTWCCDGAQYLIGAFCVGRIPKRFLIVTRSFENLSSGEKRAGCADRVGLLHSHTFFRVYLVHTSQYIKCMAVRTGEEGQGNRTLRDRQCRPRRIVSIPLRARQ